MKRVGKARKPEPRRWPIAATIASIVNALKVLNDFLNVREHQCVVYSVTASTFESMIYATARRACYYCRSRAQ